MDTDGRRFFFVWFVYFVVTFRSPGDPADRRRWLRNQWSDDLSMRRGLQPNHALQRTGPGHLFLIIMFHTVHPGLSARSLSLGR
jgi:hypothetical protein